MQKNNPLTPEEKWEQATLANNFIFYKVMRHHPDACKELLELLLGIPIDRIEMHNEETIDVDFGSKGIRLDLYVSGSDRVFDIEIQTTDTGGLPQRARYYQGAMDIDQLGAGEDYRLLKESHIIFICMADPFKRHRKNLPVYTFENLCREDVSVSLGDRTYKHFFIAPACATMLQDGEQKAFFALLTANKSGSTFTDRLKTFVDDAKRNTQWRRQFMTWEMQMNLERNLGREEGIAIGEERGIAIGIAEGKEQGIAQGERNKALETARTALAMGMSADQIAKLTGLTTAEITEL